MRSFRFTPIAAAFALSALTGAVQAQQDCANRGDLDDLYCDADNNMVADTPTDPAKLKTPSTLVFTYTPVEDPAVYEEIFSPFTKHLAECTGKRVVFYQVQSNAAEIEAMRSGRLHVGGFSTGPTAFAVNIAGTVCRQRLRERISGLQPDRGRQARQPLPVLGGPQRQTRRPYSPLVQFGPHGADGALSQGRSVS